MPESNVERILQSAPAPNTSGFELSEEEIQQCLENLENNKPYSPPELIGKFKAKDLPQLTTILDTHYVSIAFLDMDYVPMEFPTDRIGYIVIKKPQADPIVMPSKSSRAEAKNEPKIERIELERNLAMLYRWLKNKFKGQDIDISRLRASLIFRSISIFNQTELSDAFDKLVKAGCLSKTDSQHYRTINVDVTFKPEVQSKPREHKKRVGYTGTLITHERKTEEMCVQDLLDLLNNIYLNSVFSTEQYRKNSKIEEAIKEFPILSKGGDRSSIKRSYLNYLIDRGYLRIVGQVPKNWRFVKELDLEIVKQDLNSTNSS